MPESTLRGDPNRLRGLGWLSPDAGDRRRMLDMAPRIIRARTIAAGAIGAGVCFAVASGAMPWWCIVLFAVGVANLATLERRIATAQYPEQTVAASLLLCLLLLGGAAALTGGAVSPWLALLVIPVPMTAVRFRAQVVWALAGCAALIACALVFVSGLQRTIDHPLAFIAALTLLMAVTASSTALMDAELQFRSESVLDPLTGLLNRSGLEARFAEVGEQARSTGEPVCLIMCDLDHFKHVNDEHGHECGDAVLRAACEEMRSCLRSFELFYRVGGEEFLVLLPGVSLPSGIEKAETLRAAVQAGRPGGLPVTASFGVTVASGSDIDFHALYKAADGALYRAKSAGRNCVVG